MFKVVCQVCGETFYSPWKAKMCLKCRDEIRGELHITSKDAGSVVPPDPHAYTRRQIADTIQQVGTIDVESYYKEDPMNISFVNKNGEPVFWTGVKEVRVSSDTGYDIVSDGNTVVIKEAEKEE